VRDEYLERKLREKPYHSDLSTEKNWVMLKSSIVSVAEKIVKEATRMV